MGSLMRIRNLISAPQSSVRWYLVVTPQELPLDSDGAFKLGNTFRIDVWRAEGGKEPTQEGLEDYRVEVYRDDSSVPQVIAPNTPSFQVTAVAQAYRYTVYLKVKGKVWDTKDVKLTRDGEPGGGGTGPAGNGIVSTTAYYLLTTRATGVHRTTETGSWTTSIPTPTQDLPYVWRYTVTTYTQTAAVYSEPELWTSYSSGANANLLEQTNFSSLQAMDRWDVISQLVPKSGQTFPMEIFQEVTDGLQAHNAFHDLTHRTATQIYHKTVLSQSLEGKLEPATWYTLSFWIRTAAADAQDRPAAIVLGMGMWDTSQQGYINGQAVTFPSNGVLEYPVIAAWRRGTISFRTPSTLSGSDQRVSFRLMPVSASSDTNEIYLCMPKLEVGLQATSYLSNEKIVHQAQPRRRRWAVNTQYMAGEVDEPYLDTVLYGSNEDSLAFYRCIKSHVSTQYNRPGTTQGADLWTSANSAEFENLSTDLFFADKAFVRNLISMLVMTDYEGNARVEMEGSRFEIFGQGQAFAGIRLEVDETGTPSLAFYNKDGLRTFYLNGNDGLKGIESHTATWTTHLRKMVSSASPQIGEILNVQDADCTPYYLYEAAFHRVSGQVVYDDTGTNVPPATHYRTFRSQSTQAAYIPDGYYIAPNNGRYKMVDKAETDTIEPTGEKSTSRTYMLMIYRYVGGRRMESTQYYFAL